MDPLREACDRIYDLLLPDDGFAEKEAERFLEKYAPDLVVKLRSYPAGKVRRTSAS